MGKNVVLSGQKQNRTNKITFRFTDSELKKLKVVSKLLNLSTSKFIRDLLDAYYSENNNMLKDLYNKK